MKNTKKRGPKKEEPPKKNKNNNSPKRSWGLATRLEHPRVGK